MLSGRESPGRGDDRLAEGQTSIVRGGRPWIMTADRPAPAGSGTGAFRSGAAAGEGDRAGLSVLDKAPGDACESLGQNLCESAQRVRPGCRLPRGAAHLGPDRAGVNHGCVVSEGQTGASVDCHGFQPHRGLSLIALGVRPEAKDCGKGIEQTSGAGGEGRVDPLQGRLAKQGARLVFEETVSPVRKAGLIQPGKGIPPRFTRSARHRRTAGRAEDAPSE